MKLIGLDISLMYCKVLEIENWKATLNQQMYEGETKGKLETGLTY